MMCFCARIQRSVSQVQIALSSIVVSVYQKENFCSLHSTTDGIITHIYIYICGRKNLVFEYQI